MKSSAIFLVTLTIALFGAGSAGADEASERAYSQGLAELHGGGSAQASRGRFEASQAARSRFETSQAARSRFETSVAADPDDAFARYYLASALAKEGEVDDAIEHLRAALRLRPGFAEAAADLGTLLVRTDKAAEALPWLDLAAERADLRGRAMLMAGVAKLRLGELDAAVESFRAAAVHEPGVAVTARFYEGVAETRKGRDDIARGHFEWVVRQSPSSAFGVEAQHFLSKGGGFRERPWAVYLSLGVDYDSNVTLETDAQGDRADGTLPDNGDGSVNVRLGGRYRVWGNQDTALTVGYELFQRLYFDLDDYNLQGHRPGVRLTHRWRDVRVGVSLDYDYFLLEGHSYLQRVTGVPWIALHEGGWGRSEVSYRVRWNGYFRRPPGGGAAADPDGELADDVLDAVSHRPIVRQYFYLDGPGRSVSVAYLFEHRDPIDGGDSRFEYDSHGVEVGVDWLLPWRVTSRATYTFRREEYARDGRVDEPHEFVIGLRRPITANMTASAAYRGTIQDSNQFEYERHIGSLAIDYVF